MTHPFDGDSRSDQVRAYQSGIDSALEDGANILIGNSKPAHVAYLTRRFLESAEQEVRLFTGCLKQRVQDVDLYANDHLLDSMRSFVKRQGRVLILLERDIDAPDGDPAKHPMVAAAKEVGVQLDVRKVTLEDIAWLNSKNYHHHWAVMDDRAFRLEIDISRRHKAAVNFGRSDVASALARLFDRLFDSATSLPQQAA